MFLTQLILNPMFQNLKIRGRWKTQHALLASSTKAGTANVLEYCHIKQSVFSPIITLYITHIIKIFSYPSNPWGLYLQQDTLRGKFCMPSQQFFRSSFTWLITWLIFYLNGEQFFVLIVIPSLIQRSFVL